MDITKDEDLSQTEITSSITTQELNSTPEIVFCGKCDHGYIIENGKRIECSCVLKARALHYLTPIYANAKYIRDLDVTSLKGKNILADSQPQPMFKAVVKSFLLNTAMQFRHLTKTAYDCLQAYLTQSQTGDFRKFAETDLLILYLAYDTKCQAYGSILTSLLESRALSDKPTWIYSNTPISSGVFQERYSEKLVKYVETNFVKLK